MAAHHIDFWFTMGSTYSYLSVSRLADVERSTGVTFRWRPFHLLIMKPGGIAWSQRLVHGDRRHVTWLNAFVTPILSGSAVASTAFCACSTSCLVCSVTAWI
jgi:hypothetical protein